MCFGYIINFHFDLEYIETMYILQVYTLLTSRRFRMRIHARIQKWGNGLALRVAGAMRDIPHFKEGTEVDVEITEEGFTVKKSASNKKLFPFSESILVEGLTHELAHSDLLATPLANELEQ